LEGLAHLVEKRGIFGWSKFVSLYVERDKKNFEKMDFCLWLYAEMIEI